MRVPSFNILGLTVPKKSVTKNSNVWKVNWTWRFHMSIENLIRPQGQVTPKWLIGSGQNSNSSEILCLSWLPASLTKVWSKINGLVWRHNFPIISLWEIEIFRRSRAPNSVGSGPIWPKFKLVQDFMPVLIMCKFEKNLIKKTEKRWRHCFPIMSMGAFCCHGNHSFDQICPKTLMQPFPHPNDASYPFNGNKVFTCNCCQTFFEQPSHRCISKHI